MTVTTFNIADLHGRRDLLDAAIEKIEAYPNVDKGVVVFTGDYIDRGPQSMQVIDRLVQGPSDTTKWKWVCLKGNHETFLETFYFEDDIGADMFWFQYNGGLTTIKSYNEYGYSLNELTSPLVKKEVIPKSHGDFLKNLPYIYVDKARVFVHAYVSPMLPIESQSEQKMIWEMYTDKADGGWWDDDDEIWKAVVHGHDQSEHHPVHYNLRHNYDTFAWYTGRLVVGVWDETGTDPIDNIEIKLRADPRKAYDQERFIQ